jgi:imidazolonepropionase-like amidohydrolase
VLRELAFFAQADLTPLEVVQAATCHAARACGQGDRLGTLQRGKLADLLVVDGDPLQDGRALANVRAVVVGGEVAYSSEVGR